MGANRVGGLSRSSLWPGGFAPLGSTAALSPLYTAASELLFMRPGGFALLGSMAALSRLYKTAV